MTYSVGYFVGSTASTSINRRLAKALVRLAPEGLSLREIDWSGLPHYDYELDESYPPEATALKNAVEAVDAVLFLTPEYNRSIPGALKNAIDWASRPYGENSFAGKPSAVIGTSPGAISTAVAQQHLKSILLYLDSPTLGQPEGFIQFTDDLVSEAGDVVDESVADFLRDYLIAFERHIERLS